MTQIERCQLVAKTGIALATVTKWDKGKPVHPAINATLWAAAGDIGLKPDAAKRLRVKPDADEVTK